jgi:hypothetical protein
MLGPVLVVVGLAIFAFGFSLGFLSAAERDSPTHFLPPCGYGAVETIVHEQDGRSHLVCACPR